MAKILVADDDREIAYAICRLLNMEGFETDIAYNGRQAVNILERGGVSLIIMDIMMPEMDGIDATEHIRRQYNLPIILLSARSEGRDKIEGLGVGADDYVTKPYNPQELVARVRAQLRRYNILGCARPAADSITIGSITLDRAAKRVLVDGEPVRLTATEYGILALLMENKNRVFSAEEIYRRVWQEDCYAVENTVTVHIRRIREKIEINPKEPKYLKVVWGIGYKIDG